MVQFTHQRQSTSHSRPTIAKVAYSSTVVLMTEDAANRQKAERAGIASVFVRKYVEGVKDANQLLDLLAAAGAEDIEPTKAVPGRQALVQVSKKRYFLAVSLQLN
jgi:hypothetical protein